jgi:lauroyl/myristoyl acyltransferase
MPPAMSPQMHQQLDAALNMISYHGLALAWGVVLSDQNVFDKAGKLLTTMVVTNLKRAFPKITDEEIKSVSSMTLDKFLAQSANFHNSIYRELKKERQAVPVAPETIPNVTPVPEPTVEQPKV